MALPFDYTNIIVSPQQEAFNKFSNEDLIDALIRKLPKEKITNLQKHATGLTFTSTHSLFNIKYDVSVEFFRQPKLQVKYNLQLNNVILVTLGALMAAALFSKFTLSHFIWFSLIFTLIFYTINVWFIASAVKNQIKQLKAFADYDFDTAEKLSKEQQKWLADKEKCPACGEQVTEYHINCPECGLKLPGPRKSSPYNVSRFNFKEIRYDYKEDKDKPDE